MPRGRPRKDNAAPADQPAKPAKGNAAPLGIEAQLFLAADKLRKNLEPSDYKHVALGLIFLKHISIAFESRRAALLAEDPTAAEDPDEYLAENVFWVPREARWTFLQDSARQPPPSARPSTTPWPPSRRTTPVSRASCPRTTTDRRSTRSCWAS